MIVLTGGTFGFRGLCTVLGEWLTGRAKVAREREDRANAEVVLRDLAEGVVSGLAFGTDRVHAGPDRAQDVRFGMVSAQTAASRSSR